MSQDRLCGCPIPLGSTPDILLQDSFLDLVVESTPCPHPCFFLSLVPQPPRSPLPTREWIGRCSFTHAEAHHAWRTEAARHTAHAHALQVVVLACLGTLQPLGPWVVGRTHQLDHGWPTGQAPFAWRKEKEVVSKDMAGHPSALSCGLQVPSLTRETQSSPLSKTRHCPAYSVP